MNDSQINFGPTKGRTLTGVERKDLLEKAAMLLVPRLELVIPQTTKELGKILGMLSGVPKGISPEELEIIANQAISRKLEDEMRMKCMNFAGAVLKTEEYFLLFDVGKIARILFSIKGAEFPLPMLEWVTKAIRDLFEVKRIKVSIGEIIQIKKDLRENEKVIRMFVAFLLVQIDLWKQKKCNTTESFLREIKLDKSLFYKIKKEPMKHGLSKRNAKRIVKKLGYGSIQEALGVKK